MTRIKTLAHLGTKVATLQGWPTAKAFKAYRMSDADAFVVTNTAVRLLNILPDRPDTQVPLAAAFAVELERVLDAPVQLVAGTLRVAGHALFERPDPASASQAPAAGSAPEGYVWVMIGPYVADISLFRIAYSRLAPPILARQIDLRFGPGQRLLVSDWQRTSRVGLGYEPHYLFSEAEVTALMGDAFRLIQDRQDQDKQTATGRSPDRSTDGLDR